MVHGQIQSALLVGSWSTLPLRECIKSCSSHLGTTSKARTLGRPAKSDTRLFTAAPGCRIPVQSGFFLNLVRCKGVPESLLTKPGHSKISTAAKTAIARESHGAYSAHPPHVFYALAWNPSQVILERISFLSSSFSHRRPYSHRRPRIVFVLVLPLSSIS